MPLKGPRSKEEEEIYAVESFRVDIQHELQTLINRKKISRERLRRDTDIDVEEVFSDEYELTVRQLAKLTFHLGARCYIVWDTPDSKYGQALHSDVE